MAGFILLFLFIGVPLAELYVLITVGAEIGALSTIGLCVLTAVIGAMLIRAQGFSTVRKIQEHLQRKEVPAVPMLEGAFLLVAGACLLTPGLLTDAVGFACLVPPLRRALIVRFLEKRSRPIPGAGQRVYRDQEGHRVIEVEYRRED